MGVRPCTVYLILEFSSALLFSLVFTVHQVYYVTLVGLSPLQLVLTGTLLEASIFVFEIPTGVLADVKSRRLSIIVGNVLLGSAFVLEGALAAFWNVALAQVLWGLGYTFTSGATQAWIADEVGEARAGRAFLRGAQAARVGALLAIPLGVALGSLSLRLPFLAGGGALVGLGLFLTWAMTEEGFTPLPPGERTTWEAMLKTVADARQVVRRRPVLLSLLGIGLFYGLYSEGFDRLWTAHLLENFTLPGLDVVEPVVWFGAIRAVLMGASLVATEVVQRHVDTRRARPIGRALLAIAALIILALAGFGLTRSFWVAVLLYWLIGVLRNVTYPLQAAWFNLRIDDPQVRATMFSVTSQVDAVGQIAGGPAVGAVGNASIRAALVASALLLSPVLSLYRSAMRRDEEGAGDVSLRSE
jgi:DHA3 family tetracycline resistance protein-like MFS transporter